MEVNVWRVQNALKIRMKDGEYIALVRYILTLIWLGVSFILLSTFAEYTLRAAGCTDCFVYCRKNVCCHKYDVFGYFCSGYEKVPNFSLNLNSRKSVFSRSAINEHYTFKHQAKSQYFQLLFFVFFLSLKTLYKMILWIISMKDRKLR